MKRAILALLVAFIVFLLVPFIFKDRTHSWFEGPGLQGMKYSEVSFRNGDLNLAGMLFLPETEEPCPALVVIHGSGASRRGSPWNTAVVKYLQERGVAVLLPDKRGSGKSEGSWVGATFEDLAGDTDAAVDYLRRQTAFRCSSVGLIGFSQGGWIAPVVATRNADVAFVVSMSGPGVTTDEQLLYEVVNDVQEFGTYRFLARLIGPVAVRFVKTEAFWPAIAGFDPLPYWRNVSVPAFMAFGEGDKNLPVEESVRRIQALGKPNIAIRIYPGGGHAIGDPATHRISEAYLRDLIGFVTTLKIDR